MFVLLGLAVYVSQLVQWPLNSFVNNYLNDFLCMPIVLKICLKVVRFIRSDDRLQLPLLLCFTVTLLFAVYFEGYLPHVSARYTQDFWDLVCYAAGMSLFLWLEHRVPDKSIEISASKDSRKLNS